MLCCVSTLIVPIFIKVRAVSPPPSICFFCVVSPPNVVLYLCHTRLCFGFYVRTSEHIFMCSVNPSKKVLRLSLSTLILGLSWNVNLAQLVSSSVALPAQLVYHLLTLISTGGGGRDILSTPVCSSPVKKSQIATYVFGLVFFKKPNQEFLRFLPRFHIFQKNLKGTIEKLRVSIFIAIYYWCTYLNPCQNIIWKINSKS